LKWTVLAAIWFMLLLFLLGTGSLLLELIDRADAPGIAGVDLKPVVVAFLAKVGLAHLTGGLLIGLIAGLLARWTFPERKILGPVVCLSVIFFYVFSRDLVMHPVFYEPFLYRQGGLFRTAMVWATDCLTPKILDVSALCFLAGVLLTGMVRRRGQPGSIRRLVRWNAGVLGLLSLVLVGLAMMGDSDSGPDETIEVETGTGPGINLIFLGVDSLRPDRLRALGCPRVVVPNLDAFSEKSVVFREAFTPLARTAPSLVSLFTGVEPHTHGIRHMFPPRNRRTVRVPTLPRILAGRGYRSEVVTDYAGDMFKRIDLDFDAVHGPEAFNLQLVVKGEILNRTPAFLPLFNNALGHRLFPVLRALPANADPDLTADRFLERLEAMDGDRPFLLTGFFTGPHTPYAASYPGYRLFTDPEYEGDNKYAYFVRSLDRLAGLEEALPEHEVNQIRALYDGACHQMDAALGRIFRAIRRRGLWHRTIIVVFADHGESLYEPRNTSDHGKWFWGDEANRIPLIFAGGPVEDRAGIVDGVVRITDVVPTILSLLGMESPPTVEGVDLGPRMKGESCEPLALFAETGIWLDSSTTFRDDETALTYPSVEQLLVPEADSVMVLRDVFNDTVEEAKHRCLRTDRWKLVYVPTRTGVRYHLFDVKKDPANLHDLAGTQPWRVWRLAHRLHHWMKGDPGKHFDDLGHLVPAYRYFE